MSSLKCTLPIIIGILIAPLPRPGGVWRGIRRTRNEQSREGHQHGSSHGATHDFPLSNEVDWVCESQRGQKPIRDLALFPQALFAFIPHNDKRKLRPTPLMVASQLVEELEVNHDDVRSYESITPRAPDLGHERNHGTYFNLAGTQPLNRLSLGWMGGGPNESRHPG